MSSRKTRTQRNTKKTLCYTASKLGLYPELCDKAALRVVRRLQKARFETYIVGGGIRDLLLGRKPKDFDVATAAHPEQARKILGRSSRVIGKRFRLVHVLNNRKVIEVATFRGKSRCAANGMTNENTFGSLKEDIQRRDFTVNAMYYAPFSDKLLCHENALSDLKMMHLRSIGNAAERFIEDPVRMLRAARFVAGLNFHMAKEETETMKRHAGKLHCVSHNRLWFECQKLFLSGYSLRTFETLTAFGLFAVLFPQTHKLLPKEKKDGRYGGFIRELLADTDRRIREGQRVALYFVFLGFLWLAVKHRSRQSRKILPIAFVKEVLAKQNETITLPKHIACTIEKICLLSWQIENGQEINENLLFEKRRWSFKPSHFRAAHDLLTLSAHAGISAKNTDFGQLSNLKFRSAG